MLRLWFFLSFAVLSLIARSAHPEELKLYFGLLHGHTSFSDGKGTPDDAFTMGKQAGLDFMAITEHNHHQAAGDDGVFLTPQLYGQLIQSAKEHTEAGDFLAIWGQEVSTISSGNHFNVFFASEICDIDNGDFKTLYETWLPSHPEVPFIQFNHPDYREDQRASTPAHKRNNDYGIDDYDGDFTKLAAAGGPHAALIELIVGPAFSTSSNKLHHQGSHEADYLFYLNKGFRLGPSVGQDNHNKTWGKATHARMGVWATDLTADAWIEAIHNRRCFASEDEDIEVRFTVNDHLMGAVLSPSEAQVANIHVAVRDDDESDARYRVKLFYDDGVGGEEAVVIENVRLEEGETEIDFVHTPVAGSYYFVKITQQGDHNDDVWTAPVWISETLVLAANTDDPQKENISWDEASNYVTRTVNVSGRIVRSFNYRDRVVFFNFDEDYENTLSLVVLQEDFDTFGGSAGLQQRLTNKDVRVRGEITLYRGERMQIRLTSPDQILDVEGEE